MRWVIGDIHGMLTPLKALVARIRSEDPAAELLFVGDYVNRGPDSKGVIDFLLTLDRARFCRGNHDDVFDQILNGRSFAGKSSEEDTLAAFQWFMQYGLDQTLLSYGVDPEKLLEVNELPTMKGLRELTSVVPDEHKRFVRYLPGVIEDKDLFVAHAKWEPRESSEPSIASRLNRSESLRQEIIWRRFTPEEVRGPKTWMRTGYFGHTPVQNYLPGGPESDSVPVVGPRVVLLDTACALIPEGRLTAFCVETQTYLQVDRAGKALKN
jgi:serine/threonine protein phosphatase 1